LKPTTPGTFGDKIKRDTWQVENDLSLFAGWSNSAEIALERHLSKLAMFGDTLFEDKNLGHLNILGIWLFQTKARLREQTKLKQMQNFQLLKKVF
jgi:hypothetical protein